MPNITKQTQEYLFGALQRLLQKEDFMDITVSELTKVAGVSRMTFYRHYKNVYDLLSSNLQQIMAEAPVYEHLEAKDYETAIIRYLQFIRQHSDFINMLLLAKQQELLRDSIAKVMQSLMTAQHQSLPFNAHEMQYYLAYHSSGYASVIIDWISSGQQDTCEQIAAFLYKNISFQQDKKA